MSDGPIMYFVLTFLIICSAFFSGIETAFSSVNKIRLKNYEENGVKNANTALEIAENFDKALSTILVGNNVVNISSASITTILATEAFGASGVAYATAFTTVLVLIFGEILPKSYAKANSEMVALKTAGFLKLLIKLFSPVVFIFVKIKDAVAKYMASDDNNPSVTEQELMYIIETIEEEGVLNEQESELVQSAIEFDDIMVQEVLTHRVDLVALDINDSDEEIIAQVLAERYSRMPVYEKNLDNIIGIIRTRDILEGLISGEELNLRSHLSTPVYVHKTKTIGSLLTEFKRSKTHLAVVTDDYGGTLGIVTMEDLLEELVGEIWDEDEEVEQELQQITDNTYLVSGDMNVYDLLEQLDLEDKNFDSDYNSVSGWAFQMIGHIPEVGETFTYNTMKITVKTVEEQRVLWVDLEIIELEDK